VYPKWLDYCAGAGNYVVGGVQLGNVWIGVQPALGLEGDPMRLLFERDLTPHPQYAGALSSSFRTLLSHSELSKYIT